MGQVGDQVPCLPLGQLFGVGGGHECSLGSVGAIRTSLHLQRPPLFEVPIAETALYPCPLSWRVRTFPPGTQSGLPQRAYLLALSVPPAVRGLQGEYIARAKVPQSSPELFILSIKRVGHHRPKRDALLHGLHHELSGYLQLGAEFRVVLAALKMMGRSVRLEVLRPIH